MFDFDDRFGLNSLDVYEMLGFDSVTHYNMGTQKERNKDYTELIKIHKQSYEEMDAKAVKYFPEVSVDWGANPGYSEF